MKKNRQLHYRILLRMSFVLSGLASKCRIICLRAMGASIGSNVSLGRVYVSFPELLTIEDNCVIEDNVRFRSGGAWYNAKIKIENDCFIGFGTQINVGSDFFVGSSSLIAPGCIFTDANHNFTTIHSSIKSQGANYLPIRINSDVWIGSGSIILAGVVLDTGCIVGAGSLVNKSLNAYTINVGVPARQIKKRVID